MNVQHIAWHRQGNADEVCILVDIPDHNGLTPDYFFEHYCLMLYGRRTGKLRAKIIPYYDAWSMRMFGKDKYREYVTCKPDLHQVKFKHLIPQVEKHLSWAMLKV